MATEANTAVRHIVYRSINKPLMLMGVDRRYFFFAVVFGAAVFNLGSLVGGLGIFAVLYAFANWATKTDPQILPILLKPVMNPGSVHTTYDPGKLQLADITIKDTL